MKEEEKRALVNNKLADGKDFPQINQEIKTLEQSQILFKEQEKDITYLKKRIEKVEEENDKLKQKNFTLGLKQTEKRNTERESRDSKAASVTHLNRMMRVMKLENRPLIQTELREMCCTTNGIIKGCLLFAEKYNLIKKEQLNGTAKYSI